MNVKSINKVSFKSQLDPNIKKNLGKDNLDVRQIERQGLKDTFIKVDVNHYESNQVASRTIGEITIKNPIFGEYTTQHKLNGNLKVSAFLPLLRYGVVDRMENEAVKKYIENNIDENNSPIKIANTMISESKERIQPERVEDFVKIARDISYKKYAQNLVADIE